MDFDATRPQKRAQGDVGHLAGRCDAGRASAGKAAGGRVAPCRVAAGGMPAGRVAPRRADDDFKAAVAWREAHETALMLLERGASRELAMVVALNGWGRRLCEQDITMAVQMAEAKIP